jgi:hypothetical protein
MEAPAHICKAIAAIDPNFRLGWWGEPRQTEDDLNAGGFTLIELQPIRRCGYPDKPNGFRVFWDFVDTLGPMGQLGVGYASRGPIFAKDGRVRRDWDQLTHLPVIRARFKDFRHDGRPVNNYDVCSGRIIDIIKYWLTPIEKEMEDQAVKRGKDLVTNLTEQGKEATAYFRHLQNKSDATSTAMAYKFKKPLMEMERAEHEATDARLLDLYTRNLPSRYR